MAMFFFLFFLGFVPLFLCESVENATFSLDDFKCSLPDVTSLDDNLDVTRFRSDFSKISEVKFPGLIGPLNERLICKIKCIDGNWVGPLCSSTPDGRFQPILRECLYRNEHPLLAISFKNSSIEKDTSFPHGSTIVARCRRFGLYKLKGEGSLRCENGEWSPRLPECVPTTVITNFTGKRRPPTILYTVVSGSGVVVPSGELLVYPDSSVRLDCVSPRALGAPDWSWTQARGHHSAAWSQDEGEKDTHYRLVLSKMSARHTDQYTCAAPTGHTNTVTIRVVSVTCPPLVAGTRVRQFAQGARLGHAAHFACPPGYHLNGSALSTCMGDGRWSSVAPTCVETSCPPLRPGPHLTVVEQSASAGGRALFACAWGYRLAGPPGLECDADGAWSGDLPSCTPIYCPDPLVPENGRILTTPSSKHGKYTVGDLMSYACAPPLRLAGEASIVCTESGHWSHPPPFCRPPAQRRPPDTIVVGNATLVHVEE